MAIPDNGRFGRAACATARVQDLLRPRQIPAADLAANLVNKAVYRERKDMGWNVIVSEIPREHR